MMAADREPAHTGGNRLNVALAAEEGAGLRLFKWLMSGPHRVVAVFTTRRSEGTERVANLWEFVSRVGQRTLEARSVKDPALATALRDEGVDVLLNVHSLHLVHPRVLEAPRIGSFNLHPGPLPRYAGLDAPSWAIYRGERTHGVTLHWMVPELDAGPIAYQKIFEISEHDTGLSVSARCVREGLPLIASLLETCARDPAAVPRVPQDLALREVFRRKPPHGGRISWTRTAREIDAFVRAADFHPFHSPWGSGRAAFGDREVEIVKASVARDPLRALAGTVLRHEGDGAIVACGEGNLLVTLVRVDGVHRAGADALPVGARLDDGR
jgi:methionyl-tRNA formyltransferase